MGWVDGGKNVGPYIPYATCGYGVVGWRLVGSGININIASSTDDNLDRRARDGSWVCSTKTMLMGGQVGMSGWFLT